MAVSIADPAATAVANAFLALSAEQQELVCEYCWAAEQPNKVKALMDRYEPMRARDRTILELIALDYPDGSIIYHSEVRALNGGKPMTPTALRSVKQRKL